MADEEQVQSSTEETTETTEAQETETTEEQERSGSADNAGKDYQKIAEDQRKRAEKAEAENKKLRQQAQKGNDLSAEQQQRFDRIELNSLGIKDREEQEFVINAAKRLGVGLSEAASDELVSSKLDKMREAKKTKEATPAPGRQTGSTGSNISKLAEKALSTGELPTDPELRKKVKDEMKRLTKK